MNQFISNIFLPIIDFVYERMFHEKMGNEVINLLKNISYVGLGTIVATLFSFAFDILSGRVLGPEEYGKYNLVQSIAMFLCIPMIMGLSTSMVKYNSEKKEFSRQQRIISTTYIIVLIQIFACIFVFRFFEPQILRIFSISKISLDLSIIFAILFVIYTLTTETVRSLHDMKKYAILRPVFSIVLLSSLLYFFHIDLKSSQSMIYSMYIAYAITGLLVLFLIFRYLRFKFDGAWASKLTSYSFYSLMGGISSVFYSNADKILINKYMQLTDVGIYRAYNFSFTSIITIFVMVFVTVFFPYASMSENKQLLLKKIDKLIVYLIILGFPFSILFGTVILNIYGSEYTFDPKLVLLFGFTGICISIDQLYGQLMNSIGVSGIKIVSFAAIIMAIVNVLLNMLLIPLIGIEGSIIATIISYTTSILIISSKRKYINNFGGYNAGN